MDDSDIAKDFDLLGRAIDASVSRAQAESNKVEGHWYTTAKADAMHYDRFKAQILRQLQHEAVHNLVSKITDGKYYTVRLTTRTHRPQDELYPKVLVVLDYEIVSVGIREVVLPGLPDYSKMAVPILTSTALQEIRYRIRSKWRQVVARLRRKR